MFLSRTIRSITNGRLSRPWLALLVGGGILAVREITRRKRTFRNKTVVITGGARGLGLEMARLWHAEGARVAICSRTQSQLEAAAAELGRGLGDRVLAQVCDVTDRDQVRDFLAAVDARWGPVDVLVNNAGVIQVGPVECMTLADYRMAMDTHFWGPLYFIEGVLPEMRARGAGSIVNIASIGGKISVPHLVPYSASKFALVGLSEGLHAELAKDGIHVLTVCPGLMRTGSSRNALFKGEHRAEYAWFSISDALPGPTISSRRAARQIVEACRAGDAEAILTLPAEIAARGYALFPGLASRILSWGNRLLPGPGGIGTRSARGAESTSGWSPSPLTVLNERAATRNNQLD